MKLTVQLTLEQLREKARAAGPSDSAFEKLTIHEFGTGQLIITTYPGNAEGQKFLRELDVPFAIRREP